MMDKTVDIDAYVAKHHLDGVIRIPQDEYAGIPDGYLAHFNLEKTTVEAGGYYALARILKHGYVGADGIEVLPELSVDDIYLGECLEVRNFIPYDALTPADFEHSFAHVQNVDDLKRYILRRYQKSKPTLTPEHILSLGVSRILLRLSKEE